MQRIEGINKALECAHCGTAFQLMQDFAKFDQLALVGQLMDSFHLPGQFVQKLDEEFICQCPRFAGNPECLFDIPLWCCDRHLVFPVLFCLFSPRPGQTGSRGASVW